MSERLQKCTLCSAVFPEKEAAFWENVDTGEKHVLCLECDAEWEASAKDLGGLEDWVKTNTLSEGFLVRVEGYRNNLEALLDARLPCEHKIRDILKTETLIIRYDWDEPWILCEQCGLAWPLCESKFFERAYDAFKKSNREDNDAS